MKLQHIAFCLFLAALTSCNHSADPAKDEGKTLPTETEVAIPDNSFNALDWAGSYSGILPCADCEGVETAITITKNLDYSLTSLYQGKNAKKFEQKGKFEWNAEGNKITLQGLENAPNIFLVGENQLIQLDLNGNRITGNLAAKYTLQKVDSGENRSAPKDAISVQTVNKPITETKWWIVELMGKPIEKNERYFFQLGAEKNNVSAKAGCNTIAGRFEIFEDNRIVFSKMFSTKMACENMDDEQTLIDVLKNAESYYLNGNTLQLNKARMTPLAKFEAEQ